MCLNLLADIFGSSKGTDVFGKEAIKSQSWFQRQLWPLPNWGNLREVWHWEVPAAHTRTHTSHVPYEVLVGLLGVPLLPLFACLHLRQQRLPVRLIGLDDVFELLHEEQLQHSLVRVQVCQLEQLPLQDVVIPDVKERRVTVPLKLPFGLVWRSISHFFVTKILLFGKMFFQGFSIQYLQTLK